MRRRSDFRIRPQERSLEPPFDDDEDVAFDDELRAERLDVEADRMHDIDALERRMANDDLVFERERERRSHIDDR